MERPTRISHSRDVLGSMWRESRNKKGTFVDQGSRLSSLGEQKLQPRGASEDACPRNMVWKFCCASSRHSVPSLPLPQNGSRVTPRHGPCADTTHRGAPTERWSDGERAGDTYDDTGLFFRQSMALSQRLHPGRRASTARYPLKLPHWDAAESRRSNADSNCMLFSNCFNGRLDGTMVTKPRVVPKAKYGTLKPDRALRASNSAHLSCPPEGGTPGHNHGPKPSALCVGRIVQAEIKTWARIAVSLV